MLKVEFDMTGLNAQLAGFEARVGAALHPAARAGAKVLYDAVKANAPRSEKAHFTKGKKQAYQPGNLQAAIYHAFNDKISVPGKKVSFSVSWNKKKAFYGAFVEWGTSRMPAYPFLRPAYDSFEQAALTEANTVFMRTLVEGGR